MVFQGEVALSVLDTNGHAVGAANLRASEAVEANTNSGQIRGSRPTRPRSSNRFPGPTPVLTSRRTGPRCWPRAVGVLAVRAVECWGRAERGCPAARPSAGRGRWPWQRAPAATTGSCSERERPLTGALDGRHLDPAPRVRDRTVGRATPGEHERRAANSLVSLIEQGDETLEKHLAPRRTRRARAACGRTSGVRSGPWSESHPVKSVE